MSLPFFVEPNPFTYKALNMRRLLTHAFFNMFGELFFEKIDPTKHDPRECSDALSTQNDQEYPCTDYVSSTFILRNPYIP